VTALASNWWTHVAQSFWQATLAALVILAIVRLACGTSPRLRHALVSLALVKFVVPPMLPLATGLFSAAPRPRIYDLPNATLMIALMLLHGAGIAVALTRMAFAAWRLRRIVDEAEPRDGYFLSDDVPVPMTTGAAIVIPRGLHATLTDDELRHVLAHEREHQRRRDVRTGLVQSLVAALWWFDPLAHLLVAEARALREECCDDAVVARERDRRGYAAALLRVATLVPGPAPAHAAAIGESTHSLVHRIRRMAAARYAPSRRLGLAALVVIALVALVLLPGVRMPGVHLHFH